MIQEESTLPSDPGHAVVSGERSFFARVLFVLSELPGWLRLLWRDSRFV